MIRAGIEYSLFLDLCDYPFGIRIAPRQKRNRFPQRRLTGFLPIFQHSRQPLFLPAAVTPVQQDIDGQLNQRPEHR